MNCTECRDRMWPEDPRVGFTDCRTGRYYAPICQGCPSQCQPIDLDDRVGNLEAISAQAGRIPRQYQDEFQQIRGELAFVRNKVNEITERKRRHGSYD